MSEDSEDEDDPSIKFTWFNDLYLFDTESNSWDAPNVSLVDGPVPRAAHSATIYNDKMIIFGGKDSKARNQVIHFKVLLTQFNVFSLINLLLINLYVAMYTNEEADLIAQNTHSPNYGIYNSGLIFIGSNNT